MIKKKVAATAALTTLAALFTTAAGCGSDGPPSTHARAHHSASAPAGAPTDAADPDGCDAGLRPATTGLKVGATLYATVWTRCLTEPAMHILTITLYKVVGDDLHSVTSQVYTRNPPPVPFYNLLTWPCVPGTYVVAGDIEGTWSNGQDFSGVHVEGKPVVVSPDDCK